MKYVSYKSLNCTVSPGLLAGHSVTRLIHSLSAWDIFPISNRKSEGSRFTHAIQRPDTGAGVALQWLRVFWFPYHTSETALWAGRGHMQ